MAVQDYELLLRVRADLLQAISGLKGFTSELGGTKSAADAMAASSADTAAGIDTIGESADQTTARLKAMVAATAQQASVQESVRSKTERAAAQSKIIVQNADAEAAAFRRTQAAAQAYREAEASRAAAPAAAAAQAAALDAQRVAMAKLAGQIDPTISALAKLDAQEASLNALRKAGAVGLEDFTHFKGLIDQQRLSIKGAASAMHGFNINTQQTRLELGRLIKDASTGQWGRLASTGTTLANQAGFVSMLFSPIGLAIGAVTASLGAFVVTAASAAAEDDKLNAEIQKTGNYAGITTGDIDKFASHISSSVISVGTARDVIGQLAGSGRVGSQALASMGQASVDMAALTGQSADKATAEVLKLFDGTAAGALKANSQYHFLTDAIYEQIKALQDEGDEQGAMDVAAKAFHEAAIQRIQQETQELSGLAWAWNKVKTATTSTWEAMKNQAALALGSANDAAKLKDMLQRKQDSQYFVAGSEAGAYGPAPWSAADEEKLKALQDKISKSEAQAKADAAKAQLNDAAVNAAAATDSIEAKFATNGEKKKEEITKIINAYNKRMAAALANGDQKLYDELQSKQAQEISRANAFYDKKAPKIKVSKEQGLAAADQQRMVKLLNDEQGALDPTTKAWAEYNDKVSAADKVVADYIKHKGTNVAAIQAERNAVVAAAAASRDAALDKIADKDRLAFEKLRDSLKGIDGVSFGKMIGQLDQLNGYLKKGTITAQEYADATGKVLQQSTPKRPSFRGVDAVVGGPFSELDKLDAQKVEEDTFHKDSLARLDAWHKATLNSDAAFHAAELSEAQLHADQLKQIDDARTKVMLAGITDSFASAAESIKQAFGEQSQAYRVAFALQKSAAIAQATVAVYTAVSKAFANGVTPIDRAIYVAQALAQGMAIIADIKSISAGYSEGGYTGQGGKNEPAGIVHKGEVVWSQADIARKGGVGVVEAMRRGLPGYADGGPVRPLPAYLQGLFVKPHPSDTMPTTMPTRADSAGAQGGSKGSVRIVNVVDPKMVHDAMASSEGEQVILNTISRNRSTVKQTIK